MAVRGAYGEFPRRSAPLQPVEQSRDWGALTPEEFAGLTGAERNQMFNENEVAYRAFREKTGA